MAVGIEHSQSSTSFQRFKLLVWKSYLWHRYYWWWSIIEIIARCSVALYLGLSVKSDIRLTNHGATYPHPESRSQLLETITSRNYLAYSPPSKFTDQLMLNVAEKIKQKSGKKESLELLPFDSEKILAEYVVNRSISMKQEAMGVIFDNIKLKDDNSTPPNKLVYELRQSIAGDTRWLIDGDSTPGPYKKVSEYWSSGFVALQLLINEEFIGMKLDKSNNSDNSSWSAPSGVVFQPFPYPEYETSMIDREHLLSVIVLTLIATEVALSVPYIASIIFEKQNGVKNLLTVYLMEESLIWLGWFLKAFVVVLISATLTAIFLKTPFKGHGSECVRYTDFSVLWSFLILFHASNICFVLFLSSVFNRATIAALVHTFVHYLSLVLLFVTLAMNMRSSTRLFWPSTSYSAAKGIRFLATAEVHGIPFNWATALTLHANESAIIYLPIVLFFVFDVAFYSLLMLLFGFINSGDYGSKRSPFFIFSFLFFGTKHKHTATESHQVQVRESETRSEINKTKTSSKVEGSLNTEIREPVSPHHEPSIRIEGLHKEYNNVTHALERIDLEFYDNEITVLLGPKDAGKTTLLSILAGSITYDDGFIHYKGIDVSDNLDILKNDLGICFKEDRLFHYLSVKQHLMFFGRLKGLSKSDAEEETEQFLIKLEMHDEQNSAVKYLSQVLKRKLCIAIGLIGERKVLILDEPMEGLDHKSKIKIWNLLSDMRTDRTIIISTSNAREAESLADRVAILENGFVIAHGTPKYLRNNIGIHYEILVSTKKEHFNEVTEKVKSSVSAKMVRELDNEIVYSVHPRELPKFSNLFLNLEQSAKELEISNIGVSFNSIEHVMMKTGGFSNRPPVQPETTNEDSEYDLEFHDSIEGLRLRLRQMRILLGKKILYMFKDYANILKRIILPSLIAVLLTRLIEEINFNPYLAKKLSPSIYVLRDEMLNTAIYPQIMLHKKNANQELVEEYSTLIATRGGTVAKSGDSSSTESLLNYGRADLMRFRRELLAAFDLTEAETSKIAYNLWTIHSLPIAVSIYSNVLLRRMLNDDTAEITTINHPLPTIEVAMRTSYLSKRC
ncbi:ABC-type organic anion transporter ABCA8B-like isoform X2 [Planococcus citri]|uniref:ABC-type organic anion transporter ABCA8B-like isoform X2 n=1 Tax=Planococcus citri TaxID=170843 RepID=UPI0031F733F6